MDKLYKLTAILESDLIGGHNGNEQSDNCKLEHFGFLGEFG